MTVSRRTHDQVEALTLADRIVVTDKRARLALTEYFGREPYLHPDLKHGGTTVVEVSPDLHLPAGQDVGLTVKPGAAHLFIATSRRVAA